ncbi:MAG: complex I subunit 5 family protein, partial [Lachnospiraceae bacterium]|nr:complex I subunit 5 family protein [Lachnospiraceae bacterium]
FVTFLYAKEFMKNDTRVIRYDFFNLLTLGATMGIFYAADFFTLFFFFEIMSFTSFMWVAHRQTYASQYASGTYLGIAVAGGMAILMGIFIVYANFGTLEFEKLGTISVENTVPVLAAAVCMFLGFGAKAGAFPVHVWLPASYTEAPAPATTLLSAVLSKTGIFGLILITCELIPPLLWGSWGRLILIAGVITMVLGGIRAVMSGNLKTTIAYSSMSQIGFILVGIGMLALHGELVEFLGQGRLLVTDEELASFYMTRNGVFLHMVNHSIVKLVLFLIAGVVFMNAGSYELNKVRGFGRGKPFLLVTFLLAACGVGGIPLFNGYVSKTLLHESIAEYAELLWSVQVTMGVQGLSPTFVKAVEYLFLFSGGLTLAYMAKLFVVLFVERNEDTLLQDEYEGKKKYASVFSKAAIALCAVPIPLIGVLPNLVADHLAVYGAAVGGELSPFIKQVHYFSLNNLSGAVISAAVAVVVYLLVVRFLMLRRKEEGYREIFPSWLDLEKYVYRDVFYRFFAFLLGIIARILDSIVDSIVVFLRKTVYKDRPLPYTLPEGNRVTHLLGRGMENAYRIYCAARKKEYRAKRYEHKLALRSMDLFENMRIIERSLSFGLFMFCVGLGLTMIYLLLVN